jgi:hypothetical protein
MSFGVSTISINNANNGLNIANGVVKLGGTLTNNTEINNESYNLKIQSSANYFNINAQGYISDGNGKFYLPFGTSPYTVIVPNIIVEIHDTIGNNVYKFAAQAIYGGE